MSLLQGDAIDWWEMVPDYLHQTWEVFLREFGNKYMPEVYRDEKQREFLMLKHGSISVGGI